MAKNNNDIWLQNMQALANQYVTNQQHATYIAGKVVVGQGGGGPISGGGHRGGGGGGLGSTKLHDGAKVRLNPGSRFKGQDDDSVGVIMSAEIVGGDRWYNVRWANGNTNDYPESDLMIDRKPTPPKRKDFDPAKLEAVIMADENREEIISVLRQHQNKDKLMNDWGLADVLEYGTGMTFMFYGPPGTGKTWAATCIAKALDTELLTISPSQIQSSEPGGANRAIEMAFDEAKQTGKVLFIDECDSLIFNRADLGMILASEVNTLLTCIEKAEGVVILATNRIEHMDEALERRISLIVEFPTPERKERLSIWERLLPKKMPLATDVDKGALADEKLTGGQIKNVVLAAARLALANNCKEVAKHHFDAAIARIKASKNLMGTASRYQQGPKIGIGMGKSKKSTGFFKDIEKKDL